MLKNLLYTTAVLACSDFMVEFLLDTDASNYGICCMPWERSMGFFQDITLLCHKINHTSLTLTV